MTNTRNLNERVLVIDPTNRGFGYVVFEGPQRLIDWGLAHSRKTTVPRCLARIAGMLRTYQPTTLVIEDCTSRHSRRGKRAVVLLGSAVRLASSLRLRITLLTWPVVKTTLASARTVAKHHLAMMIASRFEELAERLPPKRKPWMSEDERYGIFDAAAMGLAYFAGVGTRYRKPNSNSSRGKSAEIMEGR